MSLFYEGAHIPKSHPQSDDASNVLCEEVVPASSIYLAPRLPALANPSLLYRYELGIWSFVWLALEMVSIELIPSVGQRDAAERGSSPSGSK